MHLWYARRAIPWIPFLACLLVASAAFAAAAVWPALAAVFLPGTLAASAAAPGFLLDDPAAPATRVTPRGARWAPLTRVAVALVPAALWVAAVTTVAPDGDRHTRWVLAGWSAQLLALGLAWWVSRRGVAAPGSTVAPAVAGLTLVPIVIGPFVGWTPL